MQPVNYLYQFIAFALWHKLPLLLINTAVQNRVKEPAIIMFLVAVMLSVLSFFPTSFTLFGYTTKPITMFADLTTEDHVSVKESKNEALAVKPPPPGFKDVDSLSLKKGFWPVEEYSVAKQDNLVTFYKALLNAKKKKVHLAFFGDSMIEGDIVTQDFRAMLQKRFGGRGVGFVPIKNNVPGFRKTIQNTFADNWKTYTIIEDRQADIPYGMNGEAFVPNVTGSGDANASWTSYTGVKEYAGLDSFHVVKLYYSNPNNANVQVLLSKDGKSSSVTLQGGGGLKSLSLNSGKSIHNIKLSFLATDKVYIYGLNFEDETGVYVDDLDMRGASGMQLSVINDDIMQGFQNELGIKGIVLQYGINVVHSGTDKYSYYTKGFSSTINSLKSKMPGCGILINSVSDRAVRKHGGYETMPEIHDFIEVQRGIAKQTNVAFWNLFQAMGADSSMINMVNSDLPLANKDYTHFKPMGGSWIASFMYYSVLYDFEKYAWEQKYKDNAHS